MLLYYSPDFAQGWNAMFGAIRGKLTLPPKLRELAIMSIGAINGAEYEWRQHEPDFLATGGTKAHSMPCGRAGPDDGPLRLGALQRGGAGDAGPDPRDDPQGGGDRSDDAPESQILPDVQVVELVGTIAGYNMVSRFVVATGVALE